MRLLRLVALVGLPSLLACSDPAALPKDAAVPSDTGPDAFCGNNVFYTGEYVDWDSSDASFLGIFHATWAIESGSGAHDTATTAPNGRFLLCVPPNTDPVVDVTPDGSDGKGYLPGVVVGRHAIIAAGVVTSARSMTPARVTSMFQQIGAVYDPAKGQLFVHTTNTAASLSLSADHAATQAYGAAQAWAAGDSGTYVYFPNVAITGPTVTLTASTPVTGAGSIPLSAGHMTYVEVVGQ